MAFSPVIRPGRANVRTTFQLAANLSPKGGGETNDALHESRRIILDWLCGRFPEPIPSVAYQGDVFECDEHGQKISGVYSDRIHLTPTPSGSWYYIGICFLF